MLVFWDIGHSSILVKLLKDTGLIVEYMYVLLECMVR